MKVIKLKLTDVFIDPKAQVRKSINKEEVEKYSEQMKEGDKFPNMTAFFDGKRYVLSDGQHRYRAYKSNGILETDFDVYDGGVRDAYIFAVGINNRRGLSMKPEENRDNIVYMLKDKEWSKWSDDKIAQTVGVSRITVFRLRKKLKNEGQVEDKTKTTYVNQFGNESEMDVTNLKKSNKNDPDPVVDEEPEVSNPETPNLESNQDDIVAELTNTIDEMSKENEVLKEKIAIGQWDASEIEKIDVQDILVELREKNRLLELENKTLRESRDSYQYQNAELIKTVKSLKAKLKKAGLE